MVDTIKKIRQRIENSDIGRRMVSGAFWSFSGTAIAKFIVLVASILCARILGKTEYGEFGMIRSTINMFVVVGTAGMGLTATKYISEYRKVKKERIGSIFVLTNSFAIFMGLIVSLIILFAAPYLAEHTLKAPHLVNGLRLGALLLFISILNGAQNGTLAGFENFRSIALNTLYGSIAEASFMLVGAWLYGVSGAILGFGCGFVVLFICNRFSIHRTMQKEGISISYSSFRRSDLSLFYKFSLPAALSSLMVTPTFWIVRSLLVRHNGFDELAIFEAADQWKVIILFIPSAISQVVLPILSGTIAEGGNKFWKVLKINLMLNGGVAFTLAIVVSLLSPWIMQMYGSNFVDYYTLIYLAVSTIFTALANVVGLSISSRAKMWVGFGFNLLWAIMTIIFSLLFVSNGLGASGIALALLCAYAVHTSLQLCYLRHITKQNLHL